MYPQRYPGPMEGEPYRPGKWVWTEADFYTMNWHDVAIHALAPVGEGPDRWEFLLDIDYILAWVRGAGKDNVFRFWLSPSTLVFQTASDLRVQIEGLDRDPPLSILSLGRVQEPSPRGHPGWRWTLALEQGEISLWATGYKQYIRREPVLSRQPCLRLAERGGTSFSQGPGPEHP